MLWMMASSSKPGIKSLLQKGTFKADEKSESYLRCQEENQGDDGKKKVWEFFIYIVVQAKYKTPYLYHWISW